MAELQGEELISCQVDLNEETRDKCEKSVNTSEIMEKEHTVDCEQGDEQSFYSDDSKELINHGNSIEVDNRGALNSVLGICEVNSEATYLSDKSKKSLNRSTDGVNLMVFPQVGEGSLS